MAERKQAALTASEQLAIDQRGCIEPMASKASRQAAAGRPMLLLACQHLAANLT